MTMLITRQEIINSLIRLGNQLRNEPIPEEIIQEAISANPWFTEHYIQQSITNIQRWLSEEVLSEFSRKYPHPTNTPKSVGIITAGNIPLVGFHDVLMGLLAGHILYVKCSHQDEVLMKWILGAWEKVFPSVHSYIHLVPQIEEVDFLIATGSNNTARYLSANYRHTPKLIRKNRFSVGVLKEDMSEKELTLLTEDVLLHNGLGCRNVSNCLVIDGANLESWKQILANYPQDKLNPAYLKKVGYERARLKMLGTEFIDAGVVLMVFADTFAFGHMGILTLQKVSSLEEATQLINNYEFEIQCMPGIDIPTGSSQWPDLFTFADKVDTSAVLCEV